MAMASDPMPRLFFALWPPDGAVSEIMEWAQQAHAVCGGRVMQPDTLHLTLAFLGAMPGEQAAELALAASAWRVARGTVVLSRFGRFAGPRVVWAGPSDRDAGCQDWLRGLHLLLRDQLRQFGMPLAESRFRPHVSLLRNAGPGDADGLERRPTLWEPKECVLVASQPRPGASRYRVLARLGWQP
jgi:2'-5' RNA ligase